MTTITKTTNHYPLSSNQKDIWFDQILHPDIPFYNIGGYLRIDGPIDPAIFEKSLNQVIQDNDALRIILHKGEDLPTQTFAENVQIKLDFHDFSNQENANQLAVDWMQHEFVKPFQLYEGFLFQFALCKVSDNCYYWSKKYHHLIVDEWAISLITQRMAIFYNTLLSGQPVIEQKNHSYQNFIENDIAYLESEKHVQDKHYWLDKFQNLPEPFSFSKHASTQDKVISSHRAVLTLARFFYNQLIAFAKQYNISAFHVILGVLYCYFVRTEQRDDFVIGLSTVNRNTLDSEQGLFTKIRPAWFRLGTDLNFVELVKAISSELSENEQYQQFPIHEINQQLNLEAENRLFDLTLSYLDYSYDFADSSVEFVSLSQVQTSLAISINDFHAESDVKLNFDYQLGVFETDEMERIKTRFEFLLGEILRQPDKPLKELQIMPDEELHKILYEFNDTTADYPHDKTIVDLFEEQVEKTPSNVAVVFEDEFLTYLELNRKANQLAHYLETLGVKPEVLVGICVERSLEMIIGLLGILKAGGAYVPLDPNYPKKRLVFMLEDAQVPVLLTQSKLIDDLPKHQARVVCLDTDWESISQQCEDNLVSGVQPENLAYVIYTSGSTGKPKGVMIEHYNVLAMLYGFEQVASRGEKLIGTSVCSFNFDVSVWEFFSNLCFGGTLHILQPDTFTHPKYFSRYLIEHQITCTYIHPLLLFEVATELEKENRQIAINRILIGVEPIEQGIIQRFRDLSKGMHIVNGYGPTETTICATFFNFIKAINAEKRIPIGTSVAGYKVYLTDSQLQPVPIGVLGELHIGGAGLARGYLNRPKLTKEKFIPNPFNDAPNARLYKTGDLARYLPDGNIEYLGRIDNQVKIRGFRIELGEIEAVLSQHPIVQENVIITQEQSSDGKRLIAYIVPSKEQLNNDELRYFLKEQLPDYMVPSAFVSIETIPLTPNGKIDRRALGQLSITHDQLSRETFVAHRTPVEEQLTHIWIEVLGVEKIGINDNFLKLGGHSLLVTQIISRIRKVFQIELPFSSLYDYPTVAELSQIIEKKCNNGLSKIHAIQPIAREANLPLSYFQEQLWFLAQLEPNLPIYNEPVTITINSELNVAALEQSLNEIIKRHEMLRTTFTKIDGRPVQNIKSSLVIRLSVIDLQELPLKLRESEALRIATEEAKRIFDLTQGPLLRTTLVQISKTKYKLFLTIHHILFDGISMYNALIPELTHFYKAFSINKLEELTKLPTQYVDFAHWQRQLPEEVFAEQLDYWKKILGDNLPELHFLNIHSRQVIPTFHGARQYLVLSKKLLESLKVLSQQEEVTLFTILLTVFNILLYRYTGQEDIVIGIVSNARNRIEFEHLIGYFLNTLVLRNDLSGASTFLQLLVHVHENTQGAYANSDLPFKKLVENLYPERNYGKNPIFQIGFTLEPPVTSNLDLDWNINQYDNVDTGTSRLDLSLELEERSDGIFGRIEYSTDLFDASTIERMIGHFKTLLESIVENPQQPISELPMLTKREQHQLLVEWNDTQIDYPKDKCVHQLFEEQVEQHPDNIAVVFADKQLTYKELNAKANQLAHYLQTLGVKPEILVGIYIERSIEMIVGILGILKAGGAYVPLEPSYPKERIAFMLDDAKVPVLLTQNKLVDELPDYKAQIICLDTNWETISQQCEDNLITGVQYNNLAYVIYTSGSTGKPKGVLVPHQGLLNLVFWHQRRFEITSIDQATQIANTSFDASVWELWPYLTIGAKLYLINPEALNSPYQLQDWLISKEITICFLPTPLAEEILSLEWQQDIPLRILLTGGDKLNKYPTSIPFQLINNYGPTENSVVTTSGQISSKKTSDISPSIGRPIDNTQVYVLDHHLQPTPIGIPGELHIGGVGLARGYLNRLELTKERFIPNPFSDEPNARLYKTGDLVCYLPDGNIEYLGRIDNQVKIRGFRIELGEIEATITQHPDVQDAVVITQAEQTVGNRLFAYIVPTIQNQDSKIIPADKPKQWQEFFDYTYKQPIHNDPTFNIIGWNDSHTSLPIPKEEMQEWLNGVVEQILAWQPKHVLEIGCGTGMLLFRIAPHCTNYVGTDISVEALDYIEQHKNYLEETWPKITLYQKMADNFDGIEAQSYDTVILNSVVQYFPSIDYLLTVLEKAINSVNKGGFIFIGDVRSLSFLEAFHASVQLHKASASFSKQQLQQQIQEDIRLETELVIDPDFFIALKQHFPQISHVQIELKRGYSHNEMTQFRYDVTLYINHDIAEETEIKWYDWQQDELNLSRVSSILETSQVEVVGFKQIPNARLSTQIKLLERLANHDDTVEELREIVANAKNEGIEPEEFRALGHDLAYISYINWSENSNGDYDVVFQRCLSAESHGVLPYFCKEIKPKPWHTYANNPLQKELLHQLVLELPAFLKQTLPDYMIPSKFILLEKLPLTSNGKIDRKALQKSDIVHFNIEKKHYVAPRNSEEKQLVKIWEEVLDVHPISVQDNFFDLGGHSLLAVRLMALIKQQFGENLSLATLFKAPTIEQLAIVLRKKTDLKAWLPLVAIQPKGPKRPFFCLPGVGGNVVYLNDLSDHLGNEQPFYGLQANGLDGNLPPHTCIEDMAMDYIKAIQTIQPDGPYLLGGHSFGSYVAFEMVHQLQKQGHEISLLAILDTPALIPDSLKGSNWDDAKWLTEFANMIEQFLGKDLGVSYQELQQLESKSQFVYLHERLKAVNWLPAGSEIMQFQGLVQVFKANCQTNYKLQPISSTPVALFKAKEVQSEDKLNNAMFRQEPSWGWNQFSAEPVDLYEVPGNHITMLSEPHVQVLAEKLKVCFEQALGNSTTNDGDKRIG
ncbi:amino acid adenylation domain-containing protein [Candidatus Parabeggiatoa sp. HSG14]|uniref:amino acid adenylation domain-containing protein n=1 Tax=Candidatus Parabeggiatoa sp. HSG14 TaxID=3055593 RepID=UPI0025A6900C|nr:amino acid adenylation domain-containing protein [Thiotrichales bacterium HSG14]